MFDYTVALSLGCIAALILTIYLYIKVLPTRFDGAFAKKWHQKLHDYFHFKKLYLESVLKFVFVLATVAIVCVGFFMIFAYTGYGRFQRSTFVYGLMMILFGPISLRLAYEGVMMFILLVKNVIEINNKLSQKQKSNESAPTIEE